MSYTDTKTYNDSDNFTTSDDAEVTTVAGLKSMMPDGGTCLATFTDDIDLNIADGVKTGTAVNGAASVDGFLDLANNDIRYVTYDAADNADFQQQGTIEFTIKPPYSGAPASQQVFLNICRGATEANLIQVRHDSLNGGSILFNIKDATTADIVSENMGPWTPTAGGSYKFSVNVDITTGENRILINGTQFGSTISGTGTRSSDISMFRIGSTRLGNVSANFSMKDLIVYNSVQRTEDYTPNGALPETKYSTDAQSITENTGVETDEIISLSEGSPVTPSNTSIEWAVCLADVCYWYNEVTSAWEVSTGYPQSNAIGVLNSNLATLDALPGEEVKRVMWLYSSDGLNTPTMASSTLTYGFFELSDDQSYCTVVGYVKDNGVAVSGAEIKFKTKTILGSGNNTTSINEVTTSRSNGYYEQDLVQGAAVACSINWTDANGKKHKKSGSFTVPSSGDAVLEDLI